MLAHHQLGGVVLRPRATVAAEIAGEGLFAPRAARRRGDRRERRHRAEALRVALRQHQRAVAAHRMPEDPHARGLAGQRGGDQAEQLLGDVAFHAPVPAPGRLGSVEVEARAHAEVPRIGLARHARAARAGVGRHQHQAVLGGKALRAGLDHEGLFGAGQAGQVEQHRHLRATLRLRRQEYREAHRQPDCRRIMPVEALHAAMAAVLRDQFHGARLSTAPPSGSTRRASSGRSLR
ncbi:hypothetical protein D9M72_521730 [compost metagenome]